MFKPVSLPGKLFRKYILMFSHPSKIRIQNFIGKYFFSKGIQLKNEDGVMFNLDANDWITRIMLMESGYEIDSTTLAKKILSNGGLFMDVGANFGLFTCIAAHNNDKVRAISIEPNYKVIGRLLNNIMQNRLEERTQVLNTAVTQVFQLVTLEQPASDNLGTTLTRTDKKGLLTILSCSLEFICKENNAGIIELLKIDIEGNEFEIIKDFPFDQYTIKNIILEFNQLSKISFEELRNFFITNGFKSYTVTGEELLDDKKEIPEKNIWFVNQLV